MTKSLIAKAKKLHLSKTFWINFFTGAVYICQNLTGQNIIPDKYLLEGLAIANIALRFITNQPLENK